MAPAAIVLALLFAVDLPPLMKAGPKAIVAGVAATGPLVALLAWFMRTKWRPLAAFRLSQLRFFSEIGFRLTPMRAFLLAIIAGVGEEALFRGVLQTAASREFPLAAAIILPSLLFGALHARTALYAAIAFLVSVYLGVLYALSETLLAPMITHGLYDFVAFDWTRRAIDGARAKGQLGRAKSSASSVSG